MIMRTCVLLHGVVGLERNLYSERWPRSSSRCWLKVFFPREIKYSSSPVPSVRSSAALLMDNLCLGHVKQNGFKKELKVHIARSFVFHVFLPCDLGRGQS